MAKFEDRGHTYARELSDEDKRALIEYMKFEKEGEFKYHCNALARRGRAGDTGCLV